MDWLGIEYLLEFDDFSLFVEFLGDQGSDEVEMADDCYSFVSLLVVFEEGFHFPGALAELLGGLVDYLLGD